MILFINGAFGVGKTTVAQALAACLPNSLLFDPEEVGFFLRRIVHPVEQPTDFQDLALWRMLTVHTAQALRAVYGRDLIVPMTIWQPAYFAEVVGGLRALEPACYHICLTAPAAVIYDRLQARGDAPGSFAWERVAPCVAAFAHSRFAHHIPTAGRSPAALVAAILALLPTTSQPA